MKKPAILSWIKFFIVIDMIFGFFFIWPVIIGSIALKRVRTATSRSQIGAMGWIVFIFLSWPAGLLMLFLTDKHLAYNIPAGAPSPEGGAQ
jgi:hypothetical protein